MGELRKTKKDVRGCTPRPSYCTLGNICGTKRCSLQMRVYLAKAEVHQSSESYSKTLTGTPKLGLYGVNKEVFRAVCTDAAARSGPKPGMFLAHTLLLPPTGTHKAAGTPSVSSKRVGALRTVQRLRHPPAPACYNELP